MPEADILIHTGDFSEGTRETIADFNDWLGEMAPRYRHRLVIFGNHEYKRFRAEDVDDLLDPKFVKGLLPNAEVLEHELVVVLGLRIFGSPWCPWHDAGQPGDKRLTRGPKALAHQKWLSAGTGRCDHRFDEIPPDVDILLSHGSCLGIMDCCEFEFGELQWGGSKALREAVYRVKPRVHLFGHMHEQRGVWKHLPGEAFSGGIEYELGPGTAHKTWDPPAANFPCELIACNAMLNHRKIDERSGKASSTHIAGPARLLVAEREGREPWRFSVVGSTE